jgi:hypothetical protein
MRTVRTFTVSLLIVIGCSLGIAATATAETAASTGTTGTVVTAGTGDDDTHW